MNHETFIHRGGVHCPRRRRPSALPVINVFDRWSRH